MRRPLPLTKPGECPTHRRPAETRLASSGVWSRKQARVQGVRGAPGSSPSGTQLLLPQPHRRRCPLLADTMALSPPLGLYVWGDSQLGHLHTCSHASQCSDGAEPGAHGIVPKRWQSGAGWAPCPPWSLRHTRADGQVDHKTGTWPRPSESTRPLTPRRPTNNPMGNETCPRNRLPHRTAQDTETPQTPEHKHSSTKEEKPEHAHDTSATPMQTRSLKRETRFTVMSHVKHFLQNWFC